MIVEFYTNFQALKIATKSLTKRLKSLRIAQNRLEWLKIGRDQAKPLRSRLEMTFWDAQISRW